MKLHDLRPAAGSHTKKQRVGRGIAAGKGKTAGRGTKGQKARAGGTIPAWFEGGQTPLHQRIPKLHGFRNPFKVDYEVVNLGAIANLIERGVLEPGEMPGATGKAAKGSAAPLTVNQEILRAAGAVRTLSKPMKILGEGELSTALFVVADAFTTSARTKIEAAGGTVSVLEVPKERKRALGVASGAPAAAPEASATAPSSDTPPEEAGAPEAAASREDAAAASAPAEDALEAQAVSPAEETAEDATAGMQESTADSDATPTPKTRAPRRPKAAPASEE
jgi:large subunit ribosomal protein L15